MKKSDEIKIAVTETNFLRRMTRLTLKHRVGSETITSELEVMQIMKKIKSYRKN